MSTARFVLREYMDNGKIRADVLVVPLPANLTQEEIKAKIQPIIDKHRAAWENQTPNLSDPTIRDWKHISTGGVHVSDASGKDTTIKEPDNVKKVVKEATALFQEVFLSINTRADEITATSQVERLQQALGQPQHLLEDFLNRKLDAHNITADSLTQRLSLYESHVKKQLKKDPKLIESAAMKYDEVRGEILDILEQNPSAVYEWSPRVVGEIVHFLSATSPKIQLLEQGYKDLVKEEFKKHLLSAMRAHKKKHPHDPALMIFKHTYDDLIIHEKCHDAKKILRAKGMKQAILEQLQDDPRINQALRTNEPLEKVAPIPEFKAAFRTRSAEDVIGDFAKAIRERKENSAFWQRLTMLHGPGSSAPATKQILIPYAAQRLEEIKAERVRALEESLQNHPEEEADTLETIKFLRNFTENPSFSAACLQKFQCYFYKMVIDPPTAATVEKIKGLSLTFADDPSLSIENYLTLPDHWKTLALPELVCPLYDKDVVRTDKDIQAEVDEKYGKNKFERAVDAIEQNPHLSAAEKQAQIRKQEERYLECLAAGNKKKRQQMLQLLPTEKEQKLAEQNIQDQIDKDYERQVDIVSINGASFSKENFPSWASEDVRKKRTELARLQLEAKVAQTLEFKINHQVSKLQKEGKAIPPYLRQLLEDPKLQAFKALQISHWCTQFYSGVISSAIGTLVTQPLMEEKQFVSFPELKKHLDSGIYVAPGCHQRNGNIRLSISGEGVLSAEYKDSFLFDPYPDVRGEMNPHPHFNSGIEILLKVDFLAEDGIGEARFRYQPIQFSAFDPSVTLLTTAVLSNSEYSHYGVLI